MLEVVRQVWIAPRTTAINDSRLRKTGQAVRNELGGRYLLRYLLPHQVGVHIEGTQESQWVTPTPYAPEETVSWLALPAPTQPRTLVLLLKPEMIDEIWGPRWVRLGQGIEYYLPQGFGRNALAFPWEIQVR